VPQQEGKNSTGERRRERIDDIAANMGTLLANVSFTETGEGGRVGDYSTGGEKSKPTYKKKREGRGHVLHLNWKGNCRNKRINPNERGEELAGKDREGKKSKPLRQIKEKKMLGLKGVKEQEPGQKERGRGTDLD